MGELDIRVDELKLYMGEPIQIANGVAVHAPLIRDIAAFGEEEYFSMAQTLFSTPSSMKVALADNGIMFDKITDFQLFCMLAPSLRQETTKLLLGDLDLSALKLYAIPDSDDVMLASKDRSIVITEVVYNIMVTYIRKMHGFQKKVDKPGNEITRRILIECERQDAKRNKDKPYTSFLRPIVSAVKCRMGYTMEYLRNMSLFELMDDMNRLSAIVQADAAIGGMYGGFCDMSKMDKTVLDWARNLEEDKKANPKTVLNEGKN